MWNQFFLKSKKKLLALTLARVRLLQPIGKQLPSIAILRYFKSMRMSVLLSPSAQFVPQLGPIQTIEGSCIT